MKTIKKGGPTETGDFCLSCRFFHVRERIYHPLITFRKKRKAEIKMKCSTCGRQKVTWYDPSTVCTNQCNKGHIWVAYKKGGGYWAKCGHCNGTGHEPQQVCSVCDFSNNSPDSSASSDASDYSSDNICPNCGGFKMASQSYCGGSYCDNA